MKGETERLMEGEAPLKVLLEYFIWLLSIKLEIIFTKKIQTFPNLFKKKTLKNKQLQYY